MLLRSESVASSEIENLTAGAKKIALAQLGDRSSADASLIAASVCAMHAAIALSDDLALPLSCPCTGPCFSPRTRRSPVSCAPHRCGAAAIPRTLRSTTPRRDPNRVGDLVGFMRRDDLPILTQVAIAHAHSRDNPPLRRRQRSDGQGPGRRAAEKQGSDPVQFALRAGKRTRA